MLGVSRRGSRSRDRKQSWRGKRVYLAIKRRRWVDARSRGYRGPQTDRPEFGRPGGQVEDRQAGRQVGRWAGRRRNRTTLRFCVGEARTRRVLVGKAKITKRETASLRTCSLNGTSDHHKILDNLASESRGDRGYVVGRWWEDEERVRHSAVATPPATHRGRAGEREKGGDKEADRGNIGKSNTQSGCHSNTVTWRLWLKTKTRKLKSLKEK